MFPEYSSNSQKAPDNDALELSPIPTVPSMFGTWPNSTGRIYGFRPVEGGYNQGEGALEGLNASYSGCATTGEWNVWGGLSIDLSKGNSIYTGFKVQPAALQVLPCIRF